MGTAATDKFVNIDKYNNSEFRTRGGRNIRLDLISMVKRSKKINDLYKTEHSK